MTRNIIFAAACLAVGIAGGAWLGPRANQLDPMPAPAVPVAPQPSAKIAQVQRLEILDDRGNVAIVLTTRDGIPVAVINDNGKGRVIDLAWLARKLN